ncbi:MAG: histidine kinase [Clostridium sp.]
MLIEGFLEDIELIGQSIIVDNEIQTFCSNPKEDLDYYKVSNVMKKLNKLIAIKTYIHSAVLISEDQVYWSKHPFDSFFKNELETPFFTDVLSKEQESFFTSIYKFPYENLGESNIVIYVKNIYDLNNPTKKIGKLLINIETSYLEKILKPMIQNYDDFIVTNDNELIYNYNNENYDIFNNPKGKKEFLESIANQNNGIREFNKGYVTWNHVKNFDWNVIVYLNKNSITSEANYILIFFIVFIPITIVAAFAIIYILTNKIISPIEKLSSGLMEFSKGNMNVQLAIKTGDELESLSNQFNNMVLSTNNYIEEKIKDEKIKKKFKFDMLMSKIYPHFLYNTLNSVVYMARRDGNKDIVSMVRSLILILHDSMAVHKQQIFDTLYNELQVVEAYCNIQNFRYKNKFQLKIVVSDEVYNAVIPKNILQPIIENSIFHGIVPLEGEGIIEIGAEKQGDRLRIYLCDNGIGISKEKIDLILHTSKEAESSNTLHFIGLSSIKDRLEYLFLKDYIFHMYSVEGEFTTTVINIPYLESIPENMDQEI